MQPEMPPLQLKPMYVMPSFDTIDSNLMDDYIYCPQIYNDPEAADVVFTCGADIFVVGLNITMQVNFTGHLCSQLSPGVHFNKSLMFISM